MEFAEIRQMRITREKSTSRRGSRTSYYLTCDLKTGESRKVSISNAVTQASAEAILQAARAHGIPIRDETGSH